MTDIDEGEEPSTRASLLPVVGIGASAGGLAALKELFRCMPADTGLAFVVVVHLSPKHESHLPDLLQSQTEMPVMQVSETVQMEPDRVYVIPPGCNLAAVDTHLRLSDLEEERNQRAPIDRFFETLAETHHRTAIGVILTGTGSDGTLGLQRIREQGGLTIAQDPTEAEYDSMPQSAISRGVVDQVLPVSEMPGRIIRFARSGPAVPIPDDADDAEDIEGGERGTTLKILTQVRARTGHDFSRYKPATVMRRIHRRMQLQQVESLEAYAERIRSDEDEVRQLFDDLLITVTSFFRDPETFEALERDLIPTLFEGRTGRDRVRVWSVGCATGEEAYSLAMLLLEQASRLDRPPTVQVFATDLREASLRIARAGLYPETIEADLTPDRLERFFIRENDHYRVRPALREAVVFAPHSVTKDPPFSHLDLISCRNMLIYLQRDVQEEVISLFHYALRPGGHLMLGSSETIEHSELFRPTDLSNRIYRRREVSTRGPRLRGFSTHGRFARRDPDALQRAEGPPGPEQLHLKMVEQYAPPSIMVNEKHALVHSSARAGRYLTVPAGAPTKDVFKLVREPLRLALRAGLLAARERRESHRSKPVRLEIDGQAAHVIVRVQSADADELANLHLVIFDEVSAPEGEAAGEEGTPGGLVQGLERELADSRTHLKAVIEGHEASQEEMQASNEELQSINEELRSTTEELETSKEELQSMNEELATVNQENRHKVEELAQLSGDLQNLFSSTHIATLFLDRQLRITRYTPPLTEFFNVRPADRGRPISDLTHRLGEIALEADARQVLASLVPVTREILSEDERWFLTRILPYRSTEDRIEGVTITFVDITKGKESEKAVQAARDYAESIVETLHEPLLVMTPDLRVQSANPVFYREFEVDPAATIGRRIYELGNGQWDIPALRTLLEQVLPDDEVFNNYEVRHRFEGIGERIMLVNARRLEHAQLILLGIRDITEKRRAEERLEQETRGLARLNELSDQLWQAPGLREGLDEMLEGTISLMGADRGSIQLLDQGRLRSVAQQGLDPDVFDGSDGVRPGEDAARDLVLRTRDVVVIDDVETDGDYAPWLPVAHSVGYRAVTSAPLLDGDGAVLGILTLYFDDPFRPTEQQLDRLRLYGRLAASYIERQRTTVPLWELGRTLMMAEQEERRRIGQFLHDDLQQLLFGIKLRVESLVSPFGSHNGAKLTQDLGEVLGWIRDAIASTRELSEDLVSGVVEGSDLGEALEWLATRMSERHQLVIDLRIEGEIGMMGDSRDVFLFQIVRELLFNVVKHAGVLEATVILRREGDAIELEVSDEGVGFDVEQTAPSRSGRTGLGLFSVRERIRLVGGTLDIDTAPGEGTRIRITAPLRRKIVTPDDVPDPQPDPQPDSQPDPQEVP